jgi:hypothetical protein
MKIEDIKKRVDELIVLAGMVLGTKQTNGIHVNLEDFNEFRSGSLSFLANTFGLDQSYYIEFNKNVEYAVSDDVEKGRGILKAVKQEIDCGWIFTVKSLVSAEIFSDFLEMSEYFLQENYKDPAAVMIGSVLEEHLRQLCIKNSIPIEYDKDGIMKPKKAESLNTDLAKESIYTKTDQKSITSWLGFRNSAAHGKYEEYTKEQIQIMCDGVTNFISRVP